MEVNPGLQDEEFFKAFKHTNPFKKCIQNKPSSPGSTTISQWTISLKFVLCL